MEESEDTDVTAQLLDEIDAHLELKERDQLKRRCTELQEQVGLLKSTVELDGARKVRADASKRMHLELQVGQLENERVELADERDAALARVKELEHVVEILRRQDGNQADTIAKLDHMCQLRAAILRAIYPVYRTMGALADAHAQLAYNTARAALTPDLIAALDAVVGAPTTDQHGDPCSDERCRRCYGEP